MRDLFNREEIVALNQQTNSKKSVIKGFDNSRKLKKQPTSSVLFAGRVNIIIDRHGTWLRAFPKKDWRIIEPTWNRLRQANCRYETA